LDVVEMVSLSSVTTYTINNFESIVKDVCPYNGIFKYWALVDHGSGHPSLQIGAYCTSLNSSSRNKLPQPPIKYRMLLTIFVAKADLPPFKW